LDGLQEPKIGKSLYTASFFTSFPKAFGNCEFASLPVLLLEQYISSLMLIFIILIVNDHRNIKVSERKIIFFMP
jgi:hypothetical protein